MAGFFSGAGFGAFVKGFADQATENIERGRAEDRQNDLIWANKFEKGKAEYEKESKEAKEKTKAYNTLLGMTNNNQKLADAAFLEIAGNPKKIGDAYEWIARQMSGGGSRAFDAEPGYQSQSLADIQGNLNSRYQNLEDLKGSARQGSLFRSGNTYAGNVQMPQAPGSYTPPNSTPAPAMSNQPIGMSSPGKVDVSAPTSTGRSASYGPTGAIEAGSGDIDSQIGNAKPSGAPVSLDAAAPDQVMPGNTRPTASPVPAQTGQPTQLAQTGERPWITQKQSPSDFSKIPLKPSDYSNRQGYYDALVGSGQVSAAEARAVANAAQTQEEITKQTKELNPNKQISKAQQMFANSYQDPKVMNDLTIHNEIATDAQQALDLIMSGRYKSGPGQPVLDSINKMAKAVGINDFEKTGLSNPYDAATLMDKIQSRLQFGQVANYHLGRWTQMEMNMLKQQILSGSTDINTNVKIALLMKEFAERRIRFHSEVSSELRGAQTPEEINGAMAVRDRQVKELQSTKTPWTSIDMSKRTPETAKAYETAMANGQWVEYSGKEPIDVGGQVVQQGSMLPPPTQFRQQ